MYLLHCKCICCKAGAFLGITVLNLLHYMEEFHFRGPYMLKKQKSCITFLKPVPVHGKGDPHCEKSVRIRFSRFFWSIFSRIRTEFGEILRMRETTDQINSEHEHFSRSAIFGEGIFQNVITAKTVFINQCAHSLKK